MNELTVQNKQEVTPNHQPANMEIMERVLIAGDLANLKPNERVNYYRAVCESVGLNPLTKPFEYITLNKKLTLYAKKDCADQLRRINQVSITNIQTTYADGMIIVSAVATDRFGRTDSDVGVVNIGHLKGDARANAIMKATTKAKRRVTLSLCGLGWLDETEIETIPSHKSVNVNHDTGEIITGEIIQELPIDCPYQIGDEVLVKTAKGEGFGVFAGMGDGGKYLVTVKGENYNVSPSSVYSVGQALDDDPIEAGLEQATLLETPEPAAYN